MTFVSALSLFLAAIPFGRLSDAPVSSDVQFSMLQDADDRETIEGNLVFPMVISEGWHVYSTGIPDGGPTSAELVIDSVSGVGTKGPLRFEGVEKEVYEELFGMSLRYFEDKVTFIQDLVLDKEYYISGFLRYGVCDDEQCLPPQRLEFTFSSAEKDTVAEGNDDKGSIGVGNDFSTLPGYSETAWQPVVYETDEARGGGRGLLGLLLASMLGGLMALMTPCVWPIIPMTVSYFLKRSDDRSEGVRAALLYGLSIIVIYVALGMAVTLIFGANALNSLATNAVVNILFFLVLVVFALSFFGLFEITLPSSWSTALSRKSRSSGGVAGIFFMALTLAIVSFSCTGPIIGFLLVDAASSGSVLAPVIGMSGFSFAMAVPFTLFALFPQWLNSMPKSGGWMDKVKVVLGFVELAFSLKFLSVADMAYGWNILPRDLFILLWFIMAVVLALYLSGIINLHRGSVKEKPGVAGIVGAVLCLAFALWLLPGLWGAPLKAISAFTPPMSTQHVNIKGDIVEPKTTDYSQGLALAAEQGKPVLLDFTGYGCVNCRKIEAAVWTDPRVSDMINNDFVLVSLFVDEKSQLEAPVTVVENGQAIKIRTVGDKWSLLQRVRFGANAQPFYVILSPDGSLISGPYTFDTDVNHFLSFLKSGLNESF